MSKFTDARDAAEKWFAHGWHAALTVLVPAASQLAHAEMQNILAAGLSAHASGASKAEMKDAVMKAAEDTTKSVGVSVGLDALQGLGLLALAHLTTGEGQGDAPAPAGI